MRILDKQGRLFGRINIIDALVLLLVIAVVTAGTTLVGSAAATAGVLALGVAGFAGLWAAGPPSVTDEVEEDMGEERPQQFALVDAGTHPRAVVADLTAEALTAEGEATVHELVETPALDGTHLSVRLEAEGDEQPPYGTTVAFEAPDARLTGTVVAHVDASPTQNVEVALQTDAPPSVVDAVGDSVERAADSTELRVTLNAVAAGDQLRYGGTTLRPGARVTLGGDAAVLTGTVTGVGRAPSQVRAGPAASVAGRGASVAPSAEDD